MGSLEIKRVDVRIIAATSRDPGLDERLEDIPALVQHFLKKCGQALASPFRG